MNPLSSIQSIPQHSDDRTPPNKSAQMQRFSIKTAPTEILYKVFQQVLGDDMDQPDKMSIQNSRLACRRLNAVSSHFLIQNATARMTSRSLSHLEEVCQHSEFSKSISQVIIDTRYWDRKMAQDRRQYARHCGSKLDQTAEVDEFFCAAAKHHGFKQSEVPCDWSDMYSMSDELKKIDNPDFETSSATRIQKEFLRMHGEYVKHSEDQEMARLDNNHIRRICACLQNLSALQKLIISDTGRRFEPQVDPAITGDPRETQTDTERMFDICLNNSGWNGSFETAYTTEQPTEMLGQLLSELGRAAVRPQEIEIDHNTPVDMKCLQVSEEQAEGIRDLVSHASSVTVRFGSLKRKGSLAENNDRSHDEMLALGSLFKALTNTPILKSLNISLQEYPVFHEFPQANLSDLLPVRTMTWPKLERVSFHHIPCDMEDLSVFVSSHQNSIKSFKGTGMYLRNGDWEQALDVLRGFKVLEEVEMDYLYGGQYGDGYHPEYPPEEVEQYIRKLSSQNPLSPKTEEQ